jgi:hypothetical protein
LALRLIPPLAQYLGLDPKQIGLDRGGATQTPQHRCQPQHQFALDRGPGVEIRNDGRIERSVVLDILDNVDDSFCAQPMPDGVSPRFALLGSGAGAPDSVASVGFNLPKRGHGLEPSMVWLDEAFCIPGWIKLRSVVALARWVHLKHGRLPKLSCRFKRGNLQIGPPSHFVTAAVQLVVVLAAERHGEFVADLAAERSGLRKFQVMGVARTALADETRLRSDEGEMGLVPSTPLFTDRRNRPRGRRMASVRLDECGSVEFRQWCRAFRPPPRASSAAW